MKQKRWYNYLWIISTVYLALGFFNILFAWLGLLCFFIPLIISIAGGGKTYCTTFCGRGQLFDLLGNKLKLSRKKSCPAVLRHPLFRYGFLAFFLTMFALMIVTTVFVFTGSQSLSQTVTLFWTFKLPWQWATSVTFVPGWVAQFAFGFYSLMLTSTLLGLITMVFFKPRTWCVYCPMGTMTQLVSKARNRKKLTCSGSCSCCNKK